MKPFDDDVVVGADLCVRPECTSMCNRADTQVRPYKDAIVEWFHTKGDGTRDDKMVGIWLFDTPLQNPIIVIITPNVG